MLSGKTIVITGAGRGIGRDLAIGAAAAGANVVVNDLGTPVDGEGQASAGPAQAVAAEILAAGGQAVANTDSVTSPDGAVAIIASAISAFGRVDGVVNSAGIVRDRIFHRMSYEEWRTVIDVHLHGAFNVSRAAADYFKPQKSGAMVHFTSASGLVGNFGQANYAAAKMAIVGLSRSIALDMAAYDVRSNCVAPFAWTRISDTIPPTSPEQIERIERAKKMTADRIAPFILFLLSDAARTVTGQVFATRMNEIMLFNQMRPVRSVHMSDGWTIESVAETALPAMRPYLTPLERSPEYFSWDPI